MEGRQTHHFPGPSEQDYVVHVSNMSSADYTSNGVFNPSHQIMIKQS